MGGYRPRGSLYTCIETISDSITPFYIKISRLSSCKSQQPRLHSIPPVLLTPGTIIAESAAPLPPSLPATSVPVVIDSPPAVSRENNTPVKALPRAESTREVMKIKRKPWRGGTHKQHAYKHTLSRLGDSSIHLSMLMLMGY